MNIGLSNAARGHVSSKANTTATMVKPNAGRTPEEAQVGMILAGVLGAAIIIVLVVFMHWHYNNLPKGR